MPRKKDSITPEGSSIYVSMKRLRDLLYEAQFCMMKSARIIYGTPLMEASGKALACFTLAYSVRDSGSKTRYLDEAMGWYAVLRTDLDFCIQQNIIHYKKRNPKKGEDVNDMDNYVNTKKVMMFEIVADIDERMCRWRASLTKGKTSCDENG